MDLKRCLKILTTRRFLISKMMILKWRMCSYSQLISTTDDDDDAKMEESSLDTNISYDYKTELMVE